jgi:hypothetical protein
VKQLLAVHKELIKAFTPIAPSPPARKLPTWRSYFRKRWKHIVEIVLRVLSNASWSGARESYAGTGRVLRGVKLLKTVILERELLLTLGSLRRAAILGSVANSERRPFDLV